MSTDHEDNHPERIAVAPVVRGVLFDLDNTLCDRDHAFAGYAEWFVRERLELTAPMAVEAAISMITALDAGGYGPKDTLFQTMRTQYPTLTGSDDELVEEFRAELAAHLTEPAAGATELLAALAEAEMPWGIVTNGSRNQRRKIERLRLATAATTIAISEEVGCSKPEVAIFRLAATALGLMPTEIMFVGDHPVSDIVGAAQAGMRPIWLRRDREWPADQEPLPELMIDSLIEIIPVIQRGLR